jgi:hypothetical protein
MSNALVGLSGRSYRGFVTSPTAWSTCSAPRPST